VLRLHLLSVVISGCCVRSELWFWKGGFGASQEQVEEEKEDQNNIILGEEEGAGRVMRSGIRSCFVFASIFDHDVVVVEQLLNYKLCLYS
jgi:hypothetical protein